MDLFAIDCIRNCRLKFVLMCPSSEEKFTKICILHAPKYMQIYKNNRIKEVVSGRDLWRSLVQLPALRWAITSVSLSQMWFSVVEC